MKKSRTFRKSFVATIAALCLAAPLAMMPMTVSADTTYSITITPNDSATAHKYVAYQIFSGDYDGEVLSNINWGSGVNTGKVNGKTLVEAIKGVDTGFNSLADTSASAIAKKLSDYTNDESVVKKFAEVIGDYLTSTTSGMSSETGVTGLSAGYYLVQDDGYVTGEGAKTRYILQVANNVTVVAKSSYPTIVKKVKENTDVDDYDINGDKNIPIFDTDEYKNYNDVADYNIGDDVPFIDIGTLPDTLEDYDEYYYEIVDTSDRGLDPNTTVGSDGKVTGGVTVKIDGVDVTKQATITEETNEQTGETTIKVVFEDIKSIDKGDDSTTDVSVTKESIVTVEYDSKLKEDAEIGLDGQESKVELNFSNDPNEDYDSDTDENGPDGIGTTPEDKVIVFTYELDITKQLQVTAGGDTYTPANTTNTAGFKIYNADNKVARVTEIKEGDSVTGYRIIAWDDTEDTSNNSKKYQMENIANGKVNIVGLDEGKYTVEETKTPNGYNTKEETIVLITADTLDTAADVGNVDARQAWSGVRAADALTDLQVCVDGGEDKKGNVNTGVVEAEIQNNKGSSLPSTGGIGTTIFYLGGGTMAAVAGVYLITKKRMKNEEDDEI